MPLVPSSEEMVGSYKTWGFSPSRLVVVVMVMHTQHLFEVASDFWDAAKWPEGREMICNSVITDLSW